MRGKCERAWAPACRPRRVEHVQGGGGRLVTPSCYACARVREDELTRSLALRRPSRPQAPSREIARWGWGSPSRARACARGKAPSAGPVTVPEWRPDENRASEGEGWPISGMHGRRSLGNLDGQMPSSVRVRPMSDPNKFLGDLGECGCDCRARPLGGGSHRSVGPGGCPTPRLQHCCVDGLLSLRR